MGNLMLVRFLFLWDWCLFPYLEAFKTLSLFLGFWNFYESRYGYLYLSAWYLVGSFNLTIYVIPQLRKIFYYVFDSATWPLFLVLSHLNGARSPLLFLLISQTFSSKGSSSCISFLLYLHSPIICMESHGFHALMTSRISILTWTFPRLQIHV